MVSVSNPTPTTEPIPTCPICHGTGLYLWHSPDGRTRFDALCDCPASAVAVRNGYHECAECGCAFRFGDHEDLFDEPLCERCAGEAEYEMTRLYYGLGF